MIKIGNNDISKIYLGSMEIEKIYQGDTVIYSGGSEPVPPTPPSYDTQYLTFVALESGTFSFSGSTAANTLSYSLDNGSTWVSLANNTDTPTITSGSKILWKGNCTPQSNNGIGKFISTANFDVEGNAMSLLFGDDFIGQTSLDGKNYALYGLFNGNTNVVSAENLSLPGTTLAIYCYQGMFNGCTSLTTAPQLPATKALQGCYREMFRSCTSLTTAPSLPATTLANYCYSYMFRDCTSLTTAPELPATTLRDYCYQYMFRGCTNLNSVTCLATDISAYSCTTNWLNGVASSGTFTKAASMSSWPSGANGIPNGWTVVEV